MEDQEVLRLQPLMSRPSTVDEEARTVELEIATETPVNGLVLRCSSEAVIHAPVVSVLLDHKNETSAMAGRLVSIRAEGGRVFGLAQFTDAPAAEVGWQLARSGCPTSVRAQYRLSDVQMGSRDEPDVATRWRLGEVSLTPMGADLTTTRTAGSAGEPADAQVRSNESPNIEPETEPSKDSPMDETRKQEAPAEAPGAEAGAATTTETRAASSAPAVDAEQIRAGERKRCADIMDACRKAGLDGEFAEKLIADGTPITDARAAIIDAFSTKTHQGQPQTLGGRVEVGQDHSEKRAEAMLHALEARSGIKTWDDGGAREYVGSTLLDMARECVERSGVNTRGLSKDEVALRAMHSTTDFPLLLTSIQRVTLKAAYAEERQTWQVMARQENLPDFRDMSVIEVGGQMLPEELKEGGEYKAGTIKESKGSWKLTEYGKKVNVGRRLIINDNLGYITRAIQILGRGVAVFEANQMWGLLTSGSLGGNCMMDTKALFHADHSNTGTGAIGEASISDARKAMRNQKGFDGTTPLYVEPRYILLPTALETVFDKFNTTIQPAQTSNVNIFSGYLQKVVEPRLDAKSATQFYIVGDYPGVDKMLYGYLDGEGGPSIESVSGRDPDGVTTYLRHSFGATIVQHQAFYRSTGA